MARQSGKEDNPMQRAIRQKDLVESVRHENEVLRLDLNRESREARKSNSSGAATDIGRLQEQASMYIRKIESERAKIDELDAIIGKYQERIVDQKSKLGGVNAAQVNNQLIQKQIKVLENRMDKCLLKFNETMAQNKVLRQRIDEYRRERVVFDGIYKKLEKELHEKKKEMAAIIEDSKNAYQARDKSQVEMLTLQQHADKERAEFEGEFKDLGVLIKQQQSMLEQLRLKQFERTSEKQLLNDTNTGCRNDETSRGKLMSPASGTGGLGSSASWSNQKDKNMNNLMIPLSHEKLHSHEEALRKIQEGTGIYDVNEIVTRFLEAEEQNFSLFNYVNDINSDIERLEHSIADMRNQIEKYRGQGMSTDTQRKKALRDLEEKLHRTDKKAEEYDIRYQKAVKTIAVLKNGIHSIFTRIGAASTSMEEMLGNQGVTESNMMQYLGIIEQRTSEILQAYAVSQVGLPNEQSLQFPSANIAATAGDSLGATAGKQALAVHPPSYDDVSSGDEEESEEDERPLTRQELDKKTVRDYSRKGGATPSGTSMPQVGSAAGAPGSPFRNA